MMKRTVCVSFGLPCWACPYGRSHPRTHHPLTDPLRARTRPETAAFCTAGQPSPRTPVAAAVDHIGQQVADRASQQDGGERVLLNRTAHRLLALADGAARLRIAVQSVAEVTRAPLVSVLGQLGG